MVQEIVDSGCGIIFDPKALERNRIRLKVPQPSPAEPAKLQTEQDKSDAIQPLHDELKANILWWILEIFPTSFSYQDSDGRWNSTWG